jgi:hypothetical protein
MALYDLAVSSLLLVSSFGLVGLKGFHQWLDLVQAPSSDITPELMGNIRALAIHLGPVAGAIALGVTLVCCYFVARHGSLFDQVSAALFAALLLSPHTYWQDYSLAAVVALLGTGPAVRLLLLLPWPYFYSRQDELPMIFISLSCLIFLAAKPAFRPQPDCELASGISGTPGV